jgi:hypothetical protein
MYSLLFLSVLSVCAASSHWDNFMAFVKTHNKLYTSLEMLKERFEIYRDNMEYAIQMNSESRNYTLGETFFADMTLEEFQNYFVRTPLQSRSCDTYAINFTNIVF